MLSNDHPELQYEQAYIDHAYEQLAHAKDRARSMRDRAAIAERGTHQNRHERDVTWERANNRVEQLDIGDMSLVFGRLDFTPSDERPDDDRYYIGRVAVADDASNAVVIDWRAPVAEAFYRATGVETMGLDRRRHFATRGHTLIGIDDEVFGADGESHEGDIIRGQGALFSALEESRTGRLTDIIGTIQEAQDKIIRSPLPGIVVVQGGPGTGKTVVGLHRAAYLLYTHRFPLEGQGVLVIGPNRVFLSYIEQVLPSLGEAGVEIGILAHLVPNVRVHGYDNPELGRLKGGLSAARLIRKAVRDRQRALNTSIKIPYGVEYLEITPEDSRELINATRRRARTHNSGRKLIEEAVYNLFAQRTRSDDSTEEIRRRIRRHELTVELFERIWPVLTPTELLNDLFGSHALLRLAGSKFFSNHELRMFHRPRLDDAASVVFTHDDVPLLDEALEVLGPRPRKLDEDGVRTYGHIIVDEAQDLTPMQLRVLDRRSLNGSFTLVGDIAQSTGNWGHDSWDSVLENLPTRHAVRHVELDIGYRVPKQVMDVAARVLAHAAPELAPPTSIRDQGDDPIFEQFQWDAPLELNGSASHGNTGFNHVLVQAVRRELGAIGTGNVGFVLPMSDLERGQSALAQAGIRYGQAHREGLQQQVTLVPVEYAKGLELDAVIVVDPAAILSNYVRGAQHLYVAVTRATKRLSVLYVGELPAMLS